VRRHTCVKPAFRWNFNSLTNVLNIENRTSRPIPGTVITATFEDGQIHGSAGCDSYSGLYEVSDGTIKVGPIAITEMACLDPEGVMDQELTFVQFLQDAQTFRLTDEQLQIFTFDSEALTFIPPE